MNPNFPNVTSLLFLQFPLLTLSKMPLSHGNIVPNPSSNNGPSFIQSSSSLPLNNNLTQPNCNTGLSNSLSLPNLTILATLPQLTTIPGNPFGISRSEESPPLNINRKHSFFFRFCPA